MNWRYHIIILLSITWSGLQAQSLRGLQENPVIKSHIALKTASLKSAQAESVVHLPFFEDFTTSSVFPDPAKWADKYVFINNSFAIDPVSFGVATLDAIDAKGEVYAVSFRPVSSDTLTSQEIDLSAYKGTSDVVRLSFFYQCGGNGETPELNDSLLLEFFLPASDVWTRVWFATMNQPSAFLQEIITVADSFYTEGFRFRFRNYTSLSPDEVEGKGAVSNADCWNLDYIMMNTEPLFAHQVINDIMLTDTPRRLLDYYEIIPWLHLYDAQPFIARNDINFDFRNLQQAGGLVDIGLGYYVRNLNTGERVDFDINHSEFPTDTLIHIKDPFLGPLTRSDDSKEGRIEVVTFLSTSLSENLGNDTSKILLNFKNAYGYDDGTPECGFGIEGPAMNGALLALRFRLYKPDTLRAVEMLFNKAQFNFNAKQEFQLCVWADGGGKPGDLLYMSSETFAPDSSLEALDFKQYPLNPPEDLYIADTIIYVGWKQLTEEFLNLGYDVNRNNLSRTFINLSGTWINPGRSLIPGTVMIRAIFGSSDVISGTPEIPESDPDITVYPNPVAHILNIGPEDIDIKGIVIADIAGRIVMSLSGTSHRIDVSALASGLYHVMIFTGNHQTVNRKILVSH